MTYIRCSPVCNPELFPLQRVFIFGDEFYEQGPPLTLAASRGHLDCVKYLVEEGNANIEEVGSVFLQGFFARGVSPLLSASRNGFRDIVAFLLSQGADANAPTTSLFLPLNSASCFGYLDIVKLLVEHGADIEAVDGKGFTSLLSAANSGHHEVVKYLVGVGADVNRKETDGRCALLLAVYSNELELIKVLMDHNAQMDVDSSGVSPLMAASLHGKADMVDYMISRSPDMPREEKVNALEILGAAIFDDGDDMEGAHRYWKLAMTQRYYDGSPICPKTVCHGPPASYGDFCEVSNLPQLEAIRGNHDALQAQSYLMRERILGYAYPDTMQRIEWKGIDYAKNGDFKRCIGLWMHALDIRREKLEPLHRYRLFFFRSFVMLFTSAVIERPTCQGNFVTGTHFGDFMSLFEKLTREIELVVSLLNKAGRRVIKKHSSHLRLIINMAIHLILVFTRLRYDFSASQWCAVKKAVRKLVEIDPRCPRGASLLHIACVRCFKEESPLTMICPFPSIEVVNFLLGEGANPCATDHGGNTPLHTLASNAECSIEILNALLSAGSHLDAVNSQGQSFESLRGIRGQQIHQLVNVARHTTLRCLAAAFIRRHGISYGIGLPPSLSKFVDMH